MYKVVIIDDVVLVRDAIKRLGQWGMFGITEIFEANNAKDGLEIIYRESPELIITDMKMPVMNGVELLHHMKENLFITKVIVVSGFSDFNYAKLAIQSKVVDYILKPIDSNDLNNAISSAISQIKKEYPAKSVTLENDFLTDNTIIQELISTIKKNYKSDISLEKLASSSFLSKEHLSRLFKKETGQNLFSYIMNLKLKEAKRLLSETNMTVDDIAFTLGFSNGNYFSKVFKKNVGKAPREYRSHCIE